MNQFNRAPHLRTAVYRRFLCLMAAHYFDDSILLEMSMLALATKAQDQKVANAWGISFLEKLTANVLTASLPRA